MKTFNYILLFGYSATVLIFSSCSKFLDEKPDKKLTVPGTLKDYQALLDDYSNMGIGPSEGEFSATDYYISNSDWSILADDERDIYIWNPTALSSDQAITGWEKCYRTVYFCNTVLEGLIQNPDLERDIQNWKDIKGQAHFYRANALLDLAFIWCLAYDKATSVKDLGLPLRLTIDFNLPSVRSSVQDTYQQIIEDLKVSTGMLHVTSLSKSRPSKAAAYGLLARTYLSMGQYKQAMIYADSCLALHDRLIDYNDLNLSVSYPLPKTPVNDEVIFDRSYAAGNLLALSRSKISAELYELFEDNDLRKSAYFRLNNDSTIRFRGSYTGSSSYFSGVATDEIYLIKSESLAREGELEKAKEIMEKLLIKRWRIENGISTYPKIAAQSTDELIDVILKERRMELLMRGLRWMDIKRLNLEGRNIALLRNVNGRDYHIGPNDLRFALPIPQSVISISGMEQNKR